MKKKIIIFMLGLLMIGANLHAAGDLQVNGGLGLGIAPDANVKLNLNSTDSTGFYSVSTVADSALTALSGANILVSVEGTAADGVYTGFSNRVKHMGDNTSILRMVGGDNMLQLSSTTSGTTTIVDGAAMRAVIAASNTVARSYSFPVNMAVLNVDYSFGSTSGGGSVTATNLNGLSVGAPSGSVLSVSNLAGIWVDPQTSGTTANYGIVLDGDGAGSDIVFGASQEARIYSSGGVLYASDNNFNATQISPHDPETGEWRFFSKNVKTGRVLEVNMEKLVKAVEKLTGETFMIETME